MSDLALIKKELSKDVMMQKFEEVNESKLNFKKEVGYAVQHLQKNSYLAKADQTSILQAVYNAALTGLTLSPVLNQAYLIPRNVKGKLTCVLEPSYQGLITKMIDTGQAIDVYAHCVWEKDDFEFDYALNKIVKHVPYHQKGIKREDRGEKVGAYAIAILANGLRKPCYLTADRVENIRERSESVKSARSKGTTSSIWFGDDADEMWKKTAIKALWKLMPKNDRAAQIASAIDVDNQADPIDFDAEAQERARQSTEDAAKATTESVIQSLAEDAEEEKALVWAVNLDWEVIAGEGTLEGVIKPEECRFIGTDKECADFLEEHGPKEVAVDRDSNPLPDYTIVEPSEASEEPQAPNEGDVPESQESPSDAPEIAQEAPVDVVTENVDKFYTEEELLKIHEEDGMIGLKAIQAKKGVGVPDDVKRVSKNLLIKLILDSQNDPEPDDEEVMSLENFITVVETFEDERDDAQAKELFYLMDDYSLTTERLKPAIEKEGLDYKDKEQLCREATIGEIISVISNL